MDLRVPSRVEGAARTMRGVPPPACDLPGVGATHATLTVWLLLAGAVSARKRVLFPRTGRRAAHTSWSADPPLLLAEACRRSTALHGAPGAAQALQASPPPTKSPSLAR